LASFGVTFFASWRCSHAPRLVRPSALMNDIYKLIIQMRLEFWIQFSMACGEIYKLHTHWFHMIGISLRMRKQMRSTPSPSVSPQPRRMRGL
jgi:hypothetical protein